MPLPHDDIHATMLAEFGEPATLRQSGQADQEITVVWKARAYQIDAEGEATVSGSQPVAAMTEAELAQALAPGDLLVVRGNTYRITDVDRNGEGWSRCPLHKVPA